LSESEFIGFKLIQTTQEFQPMTKSTTLNPLTAPLSGINLIEASAGTGKTYTITTLILRLILEKGLKIDNILVVTFTEAATEELRDRVRRRLHQALTAFQQGESSDEVLQSLIQASTDHKDAIFRLTNALRGFDEAGIFTIHSFCKQMLQENAFESGLLFETELIKDQSNLLREIVEDFWRQHFYESSQLFISYLVENKFNTPAQFLNVLNNGQYVGQPFLKIIPEPKKLPLTPQEQQFYQALSETQAAWQTQAAEIQALLKTDENLNRQKYSKKSIPKWCQDLANFLNAQLNSITLPEKFEKFTSSEIEKSIKTNKIAPKHDFFEICDKLQQIQKPLSDNFQQHLLALKLKLLTVAQVNLVHKKRQHQMLSFDDLLINLYQALKGRNAQSLVKLIRRKFHAALIDEFQDTDPVQYKIFHTIYGDGKQILFLIGDPKQAIYSFRGADIFTYMKASHHAQQRYTLPTNWRSEPDLIKAVNKLFEKTTNPFIFEDIPFLPVQAQNAKNQERLKIENKYLPPLQLWLVKRELANCLAEKAITKKWASRQIPFSVGYEIARLLMLGQQHQALIGNRPIIAGDIAVLVRSHKQARQIQKALTQLQIPSVLFSKESLFVSHEIMEIDRILQAVAAPNNESLIKAALTTDMLGFSGSELHKLIENDDAWQKSLIRFQDYHFIWRNVGFVQMFRKLLLREQVQSRLLSYINGERRLTNVLHTVELLQKIAVQQNLSISGLTQWLSQQRYQQANSEEQQLRLESDEKLVKIVTIHKSKGLEYPIVFCPYVWDGRLHNKNAKSFTFHDNKGNLTLDLGSNNQIEHRQLALKEEQAENLRLFYVAVTRAKHRCYLIWGAFTDASTSPLAHLLHPSINNIEKTADASLKEDLQNLSESVQISDLPTDITPYRRPIENTEKLKARRFSGRIDKAWKVSSFSALSRVKVSKQAVDKPDYDEITVIKPYVGRSVSDKNHIFSFPRGARAGNFMHSLFENLDFKAPNSELISQQLRNFGYDSERWESVLMQMVSNVLNTVLVFPDLSLSSISRDKRLNELEFYYPLSQITPQGLEGIFREFGIKIDNLDFYSVRGFMKGYIDMVFEWQGKYYLVDYKSNLLGINLEDYEPSKLQQVMTREAYLLQYYIYTVALHRYLSARLPNYSYESHFGGVFYLFLRGMNPKSNSGIFWDLPDVGLVDRLSGYLV
jgi:exodeoxyribonuclease V beta subunit